MHLETQTHARNAHGPGLTNRGSRLPYVHAQCMRIWVPGYPVPGSPVPGSTEYSVPLLKVIKGQWAGKGHTLFSDQTTKGTLEAQRAQCPSVEA